MHEAAMKFKDGTRPVVFDSALVKDIMTLTEEDRKKLLKQGPVTKEIIEKLKTEKLKRETKSKGKTKGAPEEAQS